MKLFELWIMLFARRRRKLDVPLLFLLGLVFIMIGVHESWIRWRRRQKDTPDASL